MIRTASGSGIAAAHRADPNDRIAAAHRADPNGLAARVAAAHRADPNGIASLLLADENRTHPNATADACPLGVAPCLPSACSADPNVSSARRAAGRVPGHGAGTARSIDAAPPQTSRVSSHVPVRAGRSAPL
jgi:hypothetical protein